jgi:hypothetical protein
MMRNWFYSLGACTRPRIRARRLPQNKIFESEFAFAGWDRRVASMARDPAIHGHLTRFRFNDVIKGVAARAVEMNGLVFGHHRRAPTHWRRLIIADCAASVPLLRPPAPKNPVSGAGPPLDTARPRSPGASWPHSGSHGNPGGTQRYRKNGGNRTCLFIRGQITVAKSVRGRPLTS